MAKMEILDLCMEELEAIHTKKYSYCHGLTVFSSDG